MLNGPCGGSENGKCEISILVGHDVACGWHLIFERLKKLGRLESFRYPSVDKDWTLSRDGGPREIMLATAVLSPTTQHNLVNVGLAATATDGCSTAPTSFRVQVFGDENDEAPTSDKGTVFSPDAADVGVGTLRLRAHRSDMRNGRGYLIVTSGADSAGNVGRACSTVVVPCSGSPASLAAVNAEAAAARQACEAGNGAPPAGYFVIGNGPQIAPRPKR